MKIHQRRRPFNVGDLPLFDWAQQQERRYRASFPARVLARRYALSLTTAIVVAELAFSGGRERDIGFPNG